MNNQQPNLEEITAHKLDSLLESLSRIISLLEKIMK